MTKEEFLAMSLPYELKIITTVNANLSCSNIFIVDCYKDCVEIISDNEHISIGNLVEEDRKEKCHKPILHPISDLTKPITHKGETFVPIDILSEMQWDRTGFYKYKDHPEILTSKCNYVFDEPFYIINKLIEWHFDIAGLIEKGEAIDVSNLDKNPYA